MTTQPKPSETAKIEDIGERVAALLDRESFSGCGLSLHLREKIRIAISETVNCEVRKALAAERAAAKAVMAHSEHFRDCDSLYTMAGLPTPPCTCGLDARRAEYLRLIGEKP